MKVFHMDRQNSWTGQTNRLFQVVRGLREQGDDVGVIAPPGSQLGIRCCEAGLPVVNFPMRGWRSNISILRLARYLREQKPDILHCHGPRDHLMGFLAGKLASIPHLIRTKHNHTQLKSGALSRYLYNRCSRVVTVSEFIRRRLMEDGVPPDQVKNIYTAVNLDHFTPRQKNTNILRELNIAEDRVIIGCLSSLAVRKGIEEILKAFKIVLQARPELKLTCLLVGKKWQRWSEMAEALGIKKHIVFTGFRKDVPELLSLFDIYVLPSRDEGLGTSILEAMAMGLPVVVSNVGGIPEAVNEDAGMVVPPGEPELLAEKIKILLEDPRKRQRLAENARARVEEIFSIPEMINRTRELYKEILQEV
jgi:glycosyltransferase involved in cell wall biosynthesis